MKTSRRHELQTNELADSLAHWIEAVKPYSRAALALLVAVVVAVFAWSYLSAQSERKAAEGWNELYTALDSSTTQEDLTAVATRYSDTSVGPWARVTLADVLANEGTMEIMTNKSAAREKLQRTAEEYRAVLTEVKDPMLLQRATFGLARAHEAQGTPDGLASARTEYRSIGEKWPDSPYKKDADQRAAALDTTATKEFYDWLAHYEPPRHGQRTRHSGRTAGLFKRSGGRQQHQAPLGHRRLDAATEVWRRARRRTGRGASGNARRDSARGGSCDSGSRHGATHGSAERSSHRGSDQRAQVSRARPSTCRATNLPHPSPSSRP